MTLTKQHLSSAPTLYHGLQSCLELLIPEKHTLSSQFGVLHKQPLPLSWPHKQTEKTQPNQTNCSAGEVRLSKRSLEMCTELLGNENGSYINPDKDEYSYLLWDWQSSCMNEQSKTRKVGKQKEVSNDFPPPLTSINGYDAVRVQTHREGGRLVVKVSTFTSSRSGFESERQNGTLVLSLPGDEELESDVNEEEVEEAGKMEDMEKDCSSADFNGSPWHENLKRKRGRSLCRIESCRGCNGDDGVRKRLQSVITCGYFINPLQLFISCKGL